MRNVSTSLPQRVPPVHLRPQRGSDVLTFLIDYPEVLAVALGNCSAASLLSLELVSKHVCQALRARELDDVWAAHIPMQVAKTMQECRCHIPNDMAPRGQYLRSRHATVRLRRVVDSAKTKYKIRQGAMAPSIPTRTRRLRPTPCAGCGRT